MLLESFLQLNKWVWDASMEKYTNYRSSFQLAARTTSKSSKFYIFLFNLSGMLPHCLGNFSKDFFVLNLRRNQFYGTIPQTFLKGNAIRNIDFNNNQLEGLAPWSLIIYRKLEVLDLGNNKINNTFPPLVGNSSTVTSSCFAL